MPNVTAEVVRIVDGTDSDHEMLSALWLDAWSTAAPHLTFADRTGWFRDHLQSLQGAGVRLRLARAGDIVLGFFTLAPDGYIDQFVIRPAAWGSGAGALMMAEAKRLSPTGLRLSVNDFNLRAIAFYEREGFVRGGAGVSPRGLPLWHYAWTPPG